ncbi:granulocyte colony-stimulating factor receptor [Hoplias malabaricus]|uniref:granulocyte colony-stimulating factor receptor n=1 Tax=Hoplias malabaricus TaxID=27720 RepID=UPI0034623BC8
MLYFKTMALCWISVHAVLWSIIGSFTANVRASPCADVQAPSTVVRIGSPVTASCYIKDNCSLTKGQDFQVEWPYKANLNYSNQYSQDKRLHKILISNFTNQTAMLECAICKHGHCNVVGGVQVIAAHSPLAPQNLTCQLNLTELSMWCTWNPGQLTSSIPTNYTLHTEIRESSQRFEYVPAPGKPYYRVPREGFSFFDKLQVHVKAVNTLGHATSEQWVREPMETAKLDAPELQNFGEQKYGCLSYLWHLSKPQNWIVKEFNTEIRLKPLNDFLGKEQVFTEKTKPDKRVMVCNLLHGMMYQSEMRVRYLNSPWSEWSRPINATTLMKAPTGQLVTWLKILEHSKNRPNRAELFWKPSSQFRANSMNVSYIVTLVGLHIKRTVCETYQPSCSFHILQDTRKIHLTAVNKAGKSNVTVVAMYRHTGRDSVPYLKVLSNSEESVLTTWSSPKSSDVTSYVLEWKALPVTIPTTVSFEIVDNNTFSLEITGLKPYKPYEISIYPKYKDGIGRPWNVMAYTREKAPSASPKLEFGEIRPSYVKLLWEKIPIEERNGIITSYKIFYWDDKDKDNIRDVEETENHALLKNLHPSSSYNIFLMTSTAGGSVNGSIVTVNTPSIDAFEIVLIVIPACVGLALFFLGMFTCFGSNKCLKKCLWPMIPDPANSSIKKWTVADSPQDMPPLKEVKDPALVYLSHFSLLSLSEKELWKGKTTDYLHCKKWSFDDDDDDESTNEDHSDSSRDSGIYNSGSQSESVPYATVVFANPYRTQPAPLPASQCSESTHLPTYQRSGSTHLPAYQRSESTQPLLGEEEPSSPRLFEKMPTQEELTEADHFTTFQEHSKSNEGSLWKDFPMLQALEIRSINK